MKLLLKYKTKFLFVVILTAVSSFFLVFSGYCLASLLENVITMDGDKLLKSSIILLLMWAAYIIINHISNISKSKLRCSIKNDLRYNISLQITHNQFKTFLNKNDEFISWYNNDVDKIDELYLNGSFRLISNIFNLIFAAIAIGKINILLLLVVSFMSIILFIIPKQLTSKLNEKMLVISKKSEDFIKRLADLNAGLLEFLSFNKLEKYSYFIKEASNDYEQAKKAYEIYSSFIESIITAVTLSFQMGLIILTGILAFLKYIEVGFIMSIANLSGNFLNSVSSLFALYPKIISGENIYQKHNKSINELKINKEKFNELEVKDVGYCIDDKRILNNINFNLKKGEKLLLIGESGSGKSTLLSMIYGLITNYEGEIKINGKSIKNSDVYSDIGYLRQEPHFFEDTILKNMGYFDIDVNDNSIIKDLHLSELIKQSRSDLMYSGGEKQRIVALRQLLSNQSLILVDEITSSLDKENRDILFNLILNSNKTIIYVAHNLEDEQCKLFDKMIHL